MYITGSVLLRTASLLPTPSFFIFGQRQQNMMLHAEGVQCRKSTCTIPLLLAVVSSLVGAPKHCKAV
jgi:hypothetical protein